MEVKFLESMLADAEARRTQVLANYHHLSGQIDLLQNLIAQLALGDDEIATTADAQESADSDKDA